jgi:outer membrane protein assembly factor BamB
LYALDPKDGSVRWRFDVEGAGTVRVQGGRVYFAAAKLGLHCLDTDGHLLWKQALAAGGELSTPLVVGSYVVVTSALGGAYVADVITGKLYQYFAPGHGVTGAPASDGRQVYLLSNGGYFYALGFQRSAT